MRGAVLQGLCDAEVDELEAPLDKQEVGRLEVPMHNAVLVDQGDRLEHLLPVQAHAVHRQQAALGGVLGKRARRRGWASEKGRRGM